MAQHQQHLFDMQQQQHQQRPLSAQVAKTATAVTLTGSLMVISALTLVATVIGLVIATPVLVIFSPVLVPAAITTFLVLAGLFTSGGLGAIATFVLTWMYKYVSGKHPIGADQLDMVKSKIAGTAECLIEQTRDII
ncbi:Oleosin [Heracleum sosnowskyi]|uniref:Oleosin n=1 Tax=Heracleum sosnowskyi TaxID=360622 RepID=A0AAD8HJW9_9APIA|nr:Oleosin [Heracleum sosnowskyi]